MKRAFLLCAITLTYLLLAEWALFGLGWFWSLERHATGMGARWSESMRVGAYLAELRRHPPQTPRLIAIGSSVLAAGFSKAAFADAWARHADLPRLEPHATPLSGCTLYEALMLSQLVGEPPPEFVVLCFGPREAMVVMPESVLISKQAFDVPKTMPSRSQIRNAGRESFAQDLWRTWWPGYRHRILAQQLARRLRPALRHQEVAEAEEVFHKAPTLRMDGADIPLLAPWAAWCRTRGIQPVVVMMPADARERAAARNADGALDYVQRCAAVAEPAGIWLYDFTDAIPDAQFRDSTHLSPAGAERFTRMLADALAARIRTTNRPDV